MNRDDTRIEADLQGQLREKLLATRAEWERRLGAIQSDRRRESDPLERDFEEQAVQRENDQTLDALDLRGRQELEAVEAALQRMEAGSFGVCIRCGEAIATNRLRAQPAAGTCLACAR